ncbi:MAG TPA: hypothetical protein VHS74_12905 [Solirubrobacterales bacterium]|jgi:hypothetical protein|nr:hypothetical protein [Solirubrobacterales bacterium]
MRHKDEIEVVDGVAGNARITGMVSVVLLVHFGFEGSPSDPMNLQLLIKDIRATIETPAGEPID